MAAQAQEFECTAHGLRTTVPDKGVDIEVEWYTPRTVRVLKSPHGAAVDKTSLSVIATPETVEFKTKYADGVAEMSSDVLTVRIDGRSGVVSFADAKGGELLSETENDRAFTPFNDAGRDTYAVYQGFDTDDGEGLYGLGQLQNGEMMQRNMTKYLVQGNVEDVTPLFQSCLLYTSPSPRD